MDKVSSPCGNERVRTGTARCVGAERRSGTALLCVCVTRSEPMRCNSLYLFGETRRCLQNTRPNRISVGVWNGRSGDPVSRSGVHYLIWILPPAFLSTVKRFPFPSLLFFYFLSIFPCDLPQPSSQALALEYSPGLFFRKFTWSESAFGRREADRIKISCLV